MELILQELRELSEFLGCIGYFSRSRALDSIISKLEELRKETGEAENGQ